MGIIEAIKSKYSKLIKEVWKQTLEWLYQVSFFYSVNKNKKNLLLNLAISIDFPARNNFWK